MAQGSESYQINDPNYNQFNSNIGQKAKGPLKNPFSISFNPQTNPFNDDLTHIQNKNTDSIFIPKPQNTSPNYFTNIQQPKPQTNLWQNELSGKVSLTAPNNYEFGDNNNEIISEPPLLEDLGIDIENIKQKTMAVLMIKKCDEKFISEADMSGPLLLALLFGSLLLFNGKIHFGYIYGFGVFGCVIIYFIMNFISQQKYLELYNAVSILGYCLLPIVLLSGFNVFIDLQSIIGMLLSIGAIGWASIIAAYFFQTALNLTDHKWIIAYPVCLFYSTFVLITIF